MYITGYYREDGFTEDCPICMEKNVLLVLLLKKPPNTVTTPEFPLPDSHIRLTYPFAMGNFPETDIVSTNVCCDSCAQTIITNKLSFDEEEFIYAFPIMDAAFEGEQKERTTNAIHDVLRHRFDKSALETVFLAILYSNVATLEEDDAGDAGVHIQLNALRYLCRLLAARLMTTPTLSNSVSASVSRNSNIGNASVPLIQALYRSISVVSMAKPAILQYPIGGFVILMFVAADAGITTEACEPVVWQRFLFHLIEKHRACIAQTPDQAISRLHDLLLAPREAASELPRQPHGVAQLHDETPDSATSSLDLGKPLRKRLSISPESLQSTHLLTDEELDQFRSLRTLFGFVERDCSLALSRFLQHLALEMTSVVDAIEVFDRMRVQSSLAMVFNAPALIKEETLVMR